MKILYLNASARNDGSISRLLSHELVRALIDANTGSTVVERETITDMHFVNQTWVQGTFTDPKERTKAQNVALEFSASLVEELKSADHIVIGTPIYNFSIPASLKAWIDMVCRPGMTFRAEPDHFVGLLENKEVSIVLASGGTEIQGPIDYATNYLIHIFGFLGITNVNIIPAHHLLEDEEKRMNDAREKISHIVNQQTKQSSAA